LKGGFMDKNYKLQEQVKSIKFYAVRNKEGKWFRAKGYGGYGETWVEELNRARIYNKPSSARSQVTYFATNYATYGVPDLVEFSIGEIHILDESQRVADSKRKKEITARNQVVWRRQYEVDEAKRNLEAAQKKLKELWA
jgi:hypothetical protein